MLLKKKKIFKLNYKIKKKFLQKKSFKIKSN